MTRYRLPFVCLSRKIPLAPYLSVSRSAPRCRLRPEQTRWLRWFGSRQQINKNLSSANDMSLAGRPLTLDADRCADDMDDPVGQVTSAKLEGCLWWTGSPRAWRCVRRMSRSFP